MPVLPPQRSSLCLVCAFRATATRPRLGPPQSLIAHVQVAPRSTSATKKPTLGRGEAALSLSGRFNTLHRNRTSTKTTPILEIVQRQLATLRDEFTDPDFLDSLSLTLPEFEREWLAFERSVRLWVKKADLPPGRFGQRYLEKQLRYMFYAQACSGRFTQAELDNQRDVADLRFPAEWYPATREISRVVHMHVGPTNSGKTYRALKRLEEAQSGIYLGPLRLLAHEVYTRLNAKGKPCALVTGEEQRKPEGNVRMWSCTVEMAPLNERMDVAVIDEIQMINHEDRGWAWTQAFLGLQAKEVHLCGEARTVPLIRELCALTGDKIHVHEYDRLSPLQVASRSLKGDLNRLEKGDCIVCFSVMNIHAMRKDIERRTGRKCAIVYGSLPPETRAQQARLFNDPDNDFDFLVASDAIGMGLNLSIKRVIFESIVKNNGNGFALLKIAELKQIAGRAGRYRTAHQDISQHNVKGTALAAVTEPVMALDDAPREQPEQKTIGYVTTLDQADFRELRKMMEQEAEPIQTAGLFPPSLIVERFASYFPPGTPFSYVMLRLHEISNISPRFHMCALKDNAAIADAIHSVRNLSIQDRIMLCSAPMNTREEKERLFMKELAVCIADNKSGELLDLKHLPLDVLDDPPTAKRDYLFNLEQLHKMLVLYLWLSFRFPNVFTSRKLCTHVTKITEASIERTLSEFSYMADYRAKQAQIRLEALQNLSSQEGEEADGEAEQMADAAATEDMPETVEDVLKDTSAFNADEAATPDDIYEYPMPEVTSPKDEELKKSQNVDLVMREHNESMPHLHVPTQMKAQPTETRSAQSGA